MMAVDTLRALAYEITLFMQPPYKRIDETPEGQSEKYKPHHYQPVRVSIHAAYGITKTPLAWRGVLYAPVLLVVLAVKATAFELHDEGYVA